MVAGYSETLTLDGFYASTWQQIDKELADAQNLEYPTYAWVESLSEKGEGRRVEFPVKLGSFSGDADMAFDSLDTVTPENPNLTAPGIQNWFTKTKRVAITDDMQRANLGTKAKYNYVKEQLHEGDLNQQNGLNTDLWAAAQNTNKIMSLAVTISTTTATGTISNLPRATYANWRQIYQNAGGSAFTAVWLNNYRTAKHSIARGPSTKKSMTLFMDDTVHGLYERITDSREQTIMSSGKKGLAPVLSEALVLGGVMILWDHGYVNSTTTRLLTDDTWKFKKFFEVMAGPPIRANNARYVTYEVTRQGALYCNNLRDNAIIGNFTAA